MEKYDFVISLVPFALTILGIILSITGALLKNNHKCKWWLLGIGIVFITFTVPFLINIIYKTGQENPKFITMWEAKDVLSFYGTLLAFLGTVVLGVVTVYQNKQAYRLNKVVTKLQESSFVSFVKLEGIELNKQSSKCPRYRNSKFLNPEIVNMTVEGYAAQNCFHIDCKFTNKSEYPIVSLNSHCGDKSTLNQIFYRIQDVKENPIYIAEKSSLNVRFIFPADVFEQQGKTDVKLIIWFTNVLDYTSEANLYLKLDEQQSQHKYRISKITDIHL